MIFTDASFANNQDPVVTNLVMLSYLPMPQIKANITDLKTTGWVERGGRKAR